VAGDASGGTSVPFRRRRLAGRALAAAAAVGLTVALAQQPVQGAFNGSTTSPGNQVHTATSFCTSPGNQTVLADADSWVDQANATSTSGGAEFYLVVTPQTGAVRRVFVQFPMPTVPPGCEVSGATLRIYAESQTAGRTLGAYRAASAWTEAGLNWSNQPAAVGTPATAVMPNTDQYVTWTVTVLVRELYASGDHGFVVRDQDETGPGAWQQFASRTATDKPQLQVFWS
jgi:hypothetical protein